MDGGGGNAALNTSCRQSIELTHLRTTFLLTL
ncbi:hypothetical protein ANCCAN_19724 [Ancylostoma caninum]|uniref:Uncharacterized protein n=1 Tax=Ancylostoma caninum TaxID=29170 RepID=A0A368FVY1_ANCCA|nr:hypothetical protein ANCCAN_19724 [Ancylostoma caninum]